jgi:hypothetical protein
VVDIARARTITLSVILARILVRLFVLLTTLTLSPEFALAASNDSLTVYRDIPYDHVAGVDPNQLSLDIGALVATEEEPFGNARVDLGVAA